MADGREWLVEAKNLEHVFFLLNIGGSYSYCFFFFCEIWRENQVELGSLSHFFAGFKHHPTGGLGNPEKSSICFTDAFDHFNRERNVSVHPLSRMALFFLCWKIASDTSSDRCNLFVSDGTLLSFTISTVNQL